LRFRSPSEVHRSTPAPSREPEGSHVGRCFLSWALLPHDTSGTTDPRFTGLPAPLRATSGVWVPPSRLPPSSLPTPFGAGASRLRPPRLSPRNDRHSFRSTLPSLHSPRRFASPPCGACGRGCVQGFDPVASSFCRSGSRRTRRVDAFLGFDPPERSLSSAFSSASVRGGSLHTLGRFDVRPACVTRFRGSRRSAVPSRGCRLSWASSPSDRHGTAGIGAGGGLMDSPHGSCALQAARTDLSPLASPTRPWLSPRPGTAVHR